MNRADLVDAVANKTGQSKKDAGASVDAVLESIGEALRAKTEVRLPGFGTFAAVDMPERQARNPRTGEQMTVAATTKAKFKPMKGLLG